MTEETDLAILTELRAIRMLLERPVPRDERAVALVAAIYQHAGELPFTCADLVDHARLEAASALAHSIIEAVGELNARRVGRLLRRSEGRDFSGVCIRRADSDSRDGVVWRCEFCEFETRETSISTQGGNL